jgi:homoaconitase/3-isopropylmalate dehydratase large subunit
MRPKEKNGIKNLLTGKHCIRIKMLFFDKEYTFDASEISPMITYGTNPGMGMGIDQTIPTLEKVDEAGRIL